MPSEDDKKARKDLNTLFKEVERINKRLNKLIKLFKALEDSSGSDDYNPPTDPKAKK